MQEIGQNTCLTHYITIDIDGQPLVLGEVEKVEFVFGNITKLYPSNSVTYDNGEFAVRLTQEETKTFKTPTIPVQVRVKFINGDIPLSKTKYINIIECLSKEVI